MDIHYIQQDFKENGRRRQNQHLMSSEYNDQGIPIKMQQTEWKTIDTHKFNQNTISKISEKTRIERIKNQPHLKKKNNKIVHKQNLLINNSYQNPQNAKDCDLNRLLGGGQMCSRDDYVADRQGAFYQYQEKSEEQGFSRAKSLKLERMSTFENTFTKLTTMDNIQDVLDNQSKLTSEIESIIDNFNSDYRQQLYSVDRNQVYKLSELIISYLYCQLSYAYEEQKDIQSDIQELNEHLTKIRMKLINMARYQPCLDLDLLFEQIQNLNTLRGSFGKLNKEQAEQLLKITTDVIKLSVKSEQVKQEVQQPNKISESLQTAQKLFESSSTLLEDFKESKQITSSFFSKFQTSNLFAYLMILWLQKVEVFQSKLQKSIPIIEEMEFYIDQSSEINLKSSKDIINYIFLQIDHLLERGSDELSSVIQAQLKMKSSNSNVNEVKITKVKNFVSMLLLNQNCNQINLYSQIIEQYSQPNFRYIVIQILLRFLNIKGFFESNERDSFVNSLLIRCLIEKDDSVKIVFKPCKEITQYAEQVSQSIQLKEKVIEEYNKVNKQISKILIVQQIRSFQEKISSDEDIDRLLQGSLLTMWEFTLKQKLDALSAFDKDSIYVRQHFMVKKGFDFNQKENGASQRTMDFTRGQEDAIDLIMKNYLIPNYRLPISSTGMGCSLFTSNESQPIKQTGDCRILSILAQGGMGKSTLLYRLQKEIINKQGVASFSERTNYIPIIIKFSALDSSNPSLEEYFSKHGMSDILITSLKSSQRNKLIMLDGYDEYSGKNFKVYQKLKLYEWRNTLVILTSRIEKISMKDAEHFFNYYDLNGNKGSSSSFSLVKLLKFNAEDVQDYFTQFQRLQTFSNKENQEQNAFYQIDLNNTNLFRLLKLPLHLYLLTKMVTNGEIENEFIKSLESSTHNIELKEYYFKAEFQKIAKEFISQQFIELEATKSKEIKEYVINSFFECFQCLAMHMFNSKHTTTNYQQIRESFIKTIFQLKSTKSNLLTTDQQQSLIECIHQYIDSQNITKVKLANYDSLEERQVKHDDYNLALHRREEDRIIEFTHKSLIEYFAARAMKYDFDIHKENIHKLPLADLKKFSINQRTIMNAGQNQSLAHILIKLNKLIQLDKENCDYSKNYIQQNIAENNRYIQYLKRSQINSTTDISEIDIGASNLISALFTSNFRFQNLELHKCSFSQAYLIDIKSQISFDQCNMSNALLKDVAPIIYETSNITNAVFDTVQLVYDSTNVYTFNKIVYYKNQIIAMNNCGYINSFEYDGKQFNLIRSKKISSTAFHSFHQYRDNMLTLTAFKSFFVVNADSFEIVKTYQFPCKIQNVSINDEHILILLTNKQALFGNHEVGLKSVHVHGNYPRFSPKENILFTNKKGKMQIYKFDIKKEKSEEWFELINTLEGHNEDITSASFSPNGKYLITGSLDKSFKVWDAKEGFQYLNTIQEHAKSIFQQAFSSDGKYFATCSKDKTCKIWNVEKDFELIHTINGDQVYISSLSFSPDSKYLATCLGDNFCKVWNLEKNYELVSTIHGNSAKVSSLAYSSDGKYLASGYTDNSFQIWNVQNGLDLFKVLEIHGSEIYQITFSPNCKYIATCQYTFFKLWDVENDFKLVKTVSAHASSNVYSISFSHDSKYLATGAWDNTCKVWDLENDYSLVHTVKGHNSTVYSVCFSPDGKYLATGSADQTCKIWSAQKGYRIHKTLVGHMSYVCAVAFSSDGVFFATSSYDNSYKIWNAQQEFELICTVQAHTSQINSITFSSDGKYLATSSADKTCKVWSREKDYGLVNVIQAHSLEVSQVAFSPDSQYLASCSWDKSCKIWKQKDYELINVQNGHTDTINCLAMSPDGKYLATGSRDKTCKIWNIEAGFELIYTIQDYTSEISALTFSPNGKHLAVGMWDSSCKILNIQDKFKHIKTLRGHESEITCVQFSNGNKYLATGSIDNKCKIWDVQNDFELLHTLEDHTGYVSSLAFSLNDSYLVTGSFDKTCKIWNVRREFELLSTMLEHNKLVSAVCFSNDGKLLATGCADNTCKIWEVDKGFKLIHTLEGHKQLVTSLSFSPDGRYLATGSYDSTCKIWNKEKNFELYNSIQGDTSQILDISFSPNGKYLIGAQQNNWKLLTQLF